MASNPRNGTGDERIEQLEHRVRILEDTIEIFRLLASYGPAVDSDSRETASALWSENGAFDVGVPIWAGGASMHGRSEIEAMLGDSVHQAYLSGGCSHLVSMPRVSLDGDSAVALSYQQLVTRIAGSYVVAAQSVHRWELVREGDGQWRIARRIARRMDGSREARTLLQRSLEESS